MKTLLLTLLFFWALVASADFTEGKAAFDREDYDVALREFLPLAEVGHADAAYYLGDMYDNGKGVPEDDKKAAEWLLRAAEQGHAQAQWELSLLYYSGAGVPKDKCEQAKWLQRAAKQGHPQAKDFADDKYYDPQIVCKRPTLVEFTISPTSGKEVCDRLRYWFENYLRQDVRGLFAASDPNWLDSMFDSACATGTGMMIQIPFMGDPSKLMLDFVATLSKVDDKAIRVLLSHTASKDDDEFSAYEFNLKLVEQHLKTGVVPSTALKR